MRDIIWAIVHGARRTIQFATSHRGSESAKTWMTYAHAADTKQRTMISNRESAPRKDIVLEYLSLPSYVRLCTLISICLGLAVSTLFFLLDIVVLNTTAQWDFISFTDNEMGLVVLFVGPFVFGVTGFVGSLLSYRLFLWALRNFWGLELTGRWKDLEQPGESKSNHQPM